jgi:mono/diheme cytochrome c family protein
MPLPRSYILAGIGAVAAITAAAVLLVPDRPPPGAVLLRPDDPAMVAEGRQVYDAQCASCHGGRLEGQPDWQRRRPDGKLPAPPHDESGHTWHHPDAVLLELTRLGPARVIGDPAYKSDMPGYDETLGDDAIVAVLSYIKSTWPAAIRQRHDRLNESARRN